MDDAVQFYQNNFSKTFTLPAIPSYLINDEEIACWIFEQDIPYIELDLEFDTSLWKHESKAAEKHYVIHRETQSHNGWKSCCIHGIDIDKTGVWQCYSNTEPEYHWTPLADDTPIIKKFWEEFPFEKLARVRFMKLEAGGWISPHNDSPLGYDKNFKLINHLLPINIAIVHPDECYMTLKDKGVIPWKVGDIRLVNITNDHSVVNLNNQERIHLIGHGIVGNKIKEFSELITRSYKKQYERYRV